MITIFLATHNRLETLERTIRSYEKFDNYELVIIDNGTDNQLCLDLLSEIEKRPEVRRLYRFPIVHSMEELTVNYNFAIHDQFIKGDSQWFAVTDADISFEASDPESLNAYIQLAEETGKAVGPHTVVDASIPSGYPLRSRVLACESRLLYKDTMEWYAGIPYSPWQIDTTFHLFHRIPNFNRLHMDTLRVGPPYAARHLDWYVDFFNHTVENEIYINDESAMSSWGRGWLRGFWNLSRDPELAFQMVRDARKNPFDLCNESFILSWCYQNGFGTEQDICASIRALIQAIPHGANHYLDHEEDWMAMIYESDFSSLGWD